MLELENIGTKNVKHSKKEYFLTILMGLQDQTHRAGIFKQSMGARNRVGIGLSYRPTRLHRLAKFILGIDSWAPLTFKNTGSGFTF
jgi:hypothetical protein